MAVVHHDHGAVTVGQVGTRPSGSRYAVHGKDAVCSDEFDAGAVTVRRLHWASRSAILFVLVAVTHGFAQPYAIDDAGVVELVADHRVLLA